MFASRASVPLYLSNYLQNEAVVPYAQIMTEHPKDFHFVHLKIFSVLFCEVPSLLRVRWGHSGAFDWGFATQWRQNSPLLYASGEKTQVQPSHIIVFGHCHPRSHTRRKLWKIQRQKRQNSGKSNRRVVLRKRNTCPPFSIDREFIQRNSVPRAIDANP